MKQLLFTQSYLEPENLYPFTLTRRVQDMRMGILTIREKWEKALGFPSFDLLEKSAPPSTHPTISINKLKEGTQYYLVSGHVLPSPKLVSLLKKLKIGQCLQSLDGKPVAGLFTLKNIDRKKGAFKPDQVLDLQDFQAIHYPWQLFQKNKEALLYDYELLTKGRKSALLDSSNAAINPSKIFVEKTAKLRHCIINAEDGPVYIGSHALVMEGSLIRGPVSIGDHAIVKMGTKVYGATTIGPGCLAGGEIKNVVMFSNSNKAHDGYLGDSVIGEWCNLGAGTSNSNLKNTAGDIDVHLQKNKYNAGLKCGVLMGDFTRTAINTSINSGTVIGVSANVFGSGLTPKFIPSFSWGFDNSVKYRLDKALSDADRWKKLKKSSLTQAEETILKNIYKHTKRHVQ